MRGDFGVGCMIASGEDRRTRMGDMGGEGSWFTIWRWGGRRVMAERLDFSFTLFFSFEEY